MKRISWSIYRVWHFFLLEIQLEIFMLSEIYFIYFLFLLWHLLLEGMSINDDPFFFWFILSKVVLLSLCMDDYFIYVNVFIKFKFIVVYKHFCCIFHLLISICLSRSRLKNGYFLYFSKSNFLHLFHSISFCTRAFLVLFNISFLVSSSCNFHCFL